jgi:hypothetical protein
MSNYIMVNPQTMREPDKILMAIQMEKELGNKSYLKLHGREAVYKVYRELPMDKVEAGYALMRRLPIPPGRPSSRHHDAMTATRLGDLRDPLLLAGACQKFGSLVPTKAMTRDVMAQLLDLTQDVYLLAASVSRAAPNKDFLEDLELQRKYAAQVGRMCYLSTVFGGAPRGRVAFTAALIWMGHIKQDSYDYRLAVDTLLKLGGKSQIQDDQLRIIAPEEDYVIQENG